MLTSMLREIRSNGARWLSDAATCSPFYRSWLSKAVVVFLYHDVSDRPSLFSRQFDLNVSPSLFSRQLDWIAQSFHVIDPIQLVAGDYKTPAALITFDDGNRSFFTTAVPVLKRKGLPSLCFINAGPMHGGVCWSGLVTYLQHHEPGFFQKRDPRPTKRDYTRFLESEVIQYLNSVDQENLLDRVRRFRGEIATVQDLSETAANRFVFLGNHLYNHYNATLLGGRLVTEFRKNQEVVDQFPRGVRMVSYPFSCHSDEANRLLLKEGVQRLFTGFGIPNFEPGQTLLCRFEINSQIRSPQQMKSALWRNYWTQRFRGSFS